MVKMKSIKAIFRRGQQTSKLEAQTPEDLSRSSSITNLNVDQKVKGAKPKKAESKDKLDKVADKKHDKSRALNKNNNKESGDNAPDSLIDVEALQKQLAQMASDKSNLALKLGEQTGQLNKLQNEIAHLKMLQEESTQKLEQLLEENTILRNRLRDVAHSPLSDNEKQQLLYESHRHHNSAPASIATNLLEDSGDITTCPTPEWDKHSSSNVSEVSVACLQDKINQMQETHYSTNEELQATLQELTDLQKQLTELQQENLRVNDEKNLMFESLCRQTERLNDSRNEVESLKQLLYKDENGHFETAAEREQKLVDLLKSAQEEREALLMKQEQLGNELEDSRSTHLMHIDELSQLTERVKTLESTLDAKHAEHKLLDQELAQAKDQSSSRQIEINRLKDLLENARTKINELEQDRTLSDKSELDELLDNARKEKDALESEVAHLKEKLALSKNENEKLREQVSILQEECKVTRNNAKTTQSDLEYKLEKVLAEKNALAEQLQQFQEAVNELQVQTQCQLDDKRQLSSVLSETQRNLNESERRIVDLENELSELKKIKQEQEEEWEKFQNDLLTSVRVANDFKTEAQQDLQKLIMENKAGRERIKQLEAQVEKLKGGSRRKTPVTRLSNEETLIASLNRRYREIDGLPDSQLTEEQRAVKTLKMHYDKNSPRQKPVAHKPKDKLAISKPSLESVISNPKLERIVKDSHLQIVESVTYFSDEEQKNRQSLSPTRLTLIESIGASIDEITVNRTDSFPKVQSDSGLQVIEKHTKEHGRSKSLSDLPNTSVENEPSLRRYESTENLLTLSKEKKARKKSTVNLQTLEKICSQIDPNTPESELSKEQRLALRLREVLSKEGKKATLKKNPKLFRKKVVISRPTKESVERNSKLYQIINSPFYKPVDSDVTKITKRSKPKQFKKAKERYSMPVTRQAADNSLKSSKKSRSYNDITFKFQVPNMYSEQDEIKTVDLESVLPPEEFRDQHPSKLEDKSAFGTFQINNNTFKKEHNYLDDEGDNDDKEVVEVQLHEVNQEPVQISDGNVDGVVGYEEDLVIEVQLHKDNQEPVQISLDNVDGTVEYEEDLVLEVQLHKNNQEPVQISDDNVDGVVGYEEKSVVDGNHSDVNANQSVDEMKDLSKVDEKRNDYYDDKEKKFDNGVRELKSLGNILDEGDPTDYSDNIDQEVVETVYTDSSEDDSTKQDMIETINDVITRRLEYEDDLLNDALDEEQRKERRGAIKRYSQVIVEMKEKFEKPSKEEEDEVNNETKETNIDNKTWANEDVDSPDITYPETEPREPLDVTISNNIEEIVDPNEVKFAIIDSKELIENPNPEFEQKESNMIDEMDGHIKTNVASSTAVAEVTSDEDVTSDTVSDVWRCETHISAVGGKLIETHLVSFVTSDYGFSDLLMQSRIKDDIVLDEEGKEVNSTFSKLFKDEFETIEADTTDDQLVDSVVNNENLNISKIENSDISKIENSNVTEIDRDLPHNEKYFIQPSTDHNREQKINTEEENTRSYAEDADLTQDEINFIDSLKCETDPRNISEINLEDVELVLAMKEKYLSGRDIDKTDEELTIDDQPDDENSLHLKKTLGKDEKEEISRPTLPDINVEDLTLDRMKEQSSGSKPLESPTSEIHTFPPILSPTKLNKPSSYEPVYENFYIASNKSSTRTQSSISGKKPIALPRVSSIDSDQPIYKEFGGQVRKTQFSISYNQRKRDSFKGYKQEKATSVKDLRNMFERKSQSDFSRLVSKALEDDSSN